MCALLALHGFGDNYAKKLMYMKAPRKYDELVTEMIVTGSKGRL